MLAQLALLALSILAVAAALLAARSDKPDRLRADEEAVTASERRWSRVGRNRRR